MKRATLSLCASAAAILALAAAAAPASAKVTPKTGVYYQAVGKAYGQLTTAKGKVSSLTAAVRFKTASGAECQQGEFNTSDGVSLVVFTPKRPLAVNRKSKFGISNAPMPDAPGAKISLNGKFASANKATFFIKVTIGSCKAGLNLKNAKYYAGG